MHKCIFYSCYRLLINISSLNFISFPDHIEEDNSHSEHKMWKDVNVYIYSDERQAIRDTVEAIHRYIKESTKSQIEKNSLIANFNQHKVFNIKDC